MRQRKIPIRLIIIIHQIHATIECVVVDKQNYRLPLMIMIMMEVWKCACESCRACPFIGKASANKLNGFMLMIFQLDVHRIDSFCCYCWRWPCGWTGREGVVLLMLFVRYRPNDNEGPMVGQKLHCVAVSCRRIKPPKSKQKLSNRITLACVEFYYCPNWIVVDTVGLLCARKQSTESQMDVFAVCCVLGTRRPNWVKLGNARVRRRNLFGWLVTATDPLHTFTLTLPNWVSFDGKFYWTNYIL